jgi:hypothetical protein
MREWKGTRHLVVLIAASMPLLNSVVEAESDKAHREEGEYRVFYDGKAIGTENYVILWSEDSASSSSILKFRNPAEERQNVKLETKLEMSGKFVPRSYRLESDVDGKKGVIEGKFAPNQAIFEYQGGEKPSRSGLLVGNQFTLLDTNIFHHFIFLARLLGKEGRQKMQEFEVVIPQEKERGFLRVSELRRETITLNGKKIKARHIQVDSGAVLIELWLDRNNILQKISVPLRQIEVLRGN